jgi:hypothetical protein
MAHDRTEGRRPGRRMFKPTIDGRLENRTLLSKVMPIKSQVAAGGQAAVVTDTAGEQFFVSVINGGTVRALPANDGRINIVVDGSNIDTSLQINQVLPNHSLTGGAHTFNTSLSNQYGTLNIASITVTSGTIGFIEGYRDAVLSGPVIVAGTNRVQRIAFEGILPGGAIGVGGDLDTLDILNDANFTNSSGLFVGRDLNSLSVGGNLTFSNGANFNVVRDVGLTPQAAQGTGPAGQGISVTGNMSIVGNSGFSIGRFLDGFLVVNGSYSGADRSLIGGLLLPTYIAINQSLTPPINNIFIKGSISA